MGTIFYEFLHETGEIKGQEKDENVEISLPLSLIPIMLAGNVNLQSARRRANRERPTRFYHISFPCDNKFAPRAKITRLSPLLALKENIKRVFCPWFLL